MHTRLSEKISNTWAFGVKRGRFPTKQVLRPQREFHAIALGGGVKLDVEKRGTLIDS